MSMLDQPARPRSPQGPAAEDLGQRGLLGGRGADRAGQRAARGVGGPADRVAGARRRLRQRQRHPGCCPVRCPRRRRRLCARLLQDRPGPRARRGPRRRVPARRRRAAAGRDPHRWTRCCPFSGPCSPPTTGVRQQRSCGSPGPGGTVGLASWTRDGFIGEMFRVITSHVPAPAECSRRCSGVTRSTSRSCSNRPWPRSVAKSGPAPGGSPPPRSSSRSSGGGTGRRSRPSRLWTRRGNVLWPPTSPTSPAARPAPRRRQRRDPPRYLESVLILH